ncbi:MAG: DEAD/DEAH box helicase [Planctomycetia bacterium]|nr:DEAD/DEAH box helicase [Planctomycetia bacterium]
MVTDFFHPVVAAWFERKFRAPTDAQERGWPEIVAGRHTLIAAPTGSGKTLAAFLVCIDRLLREAIGGTLKNETSVVYVSPLKALSNDIQRNLEIPLAEIQDAALQARRLVPEIRTALRTGDTPAAQRQAMTRRPPHILVTTPESLYLILTSARGRETLRSVKTVIVDEIHALARDKRGSHLSLTLARLDALCRERSGKTPTRIGLSATQRPMDEVARFLVGTRNVAADGTPQCSIVDVGHLRELDLSIVVPPTELSAACSNEQWEEVYERLAEHIQSHRSTLVFVNTRRLAERVSHHLASLMGGEAIASHHGSLSREIRLSAERRLQEGKLKAIVATASLELGIDVGYIDLVCQLSTPRSIATFLQRVGRAGHSLGAVPKGRLFPLTRDDMIECLALIRAVRHKRLDAVEPPVQPVDILAQQIIAAVAAQESSEDELFEICHSAWPYHNLTRERFDAVLAMASDGIGRGMRRGAYVHRDRIHGKLRARRGARIAAVTSGGAIPDTADYRVVTDGDRTFVGTINEDFAIESMAGDIFLLGNTSWIIRAVRGGEVIVSDAQGAPATIPFWLGEAPGRTRDLSHEVSQLREEIAQRLADVDVATAWLQDECGAPPEAARQAIDYVAAQVAAVGFVPTDRKIVFERFFDEAGGMQLVIHAPLGSRINRAWGLALRKRFCRSFNFELQAAADDNGIVLSLGPQHSFPLEQMFKLVNPGNARLILEQALLDAPMFQVRWRWNATRALAILRQQGGKKVPPAILRMRTDDLLSAVFPMATACLENVVGDIEIPDHPLVQQTVHDCLHEAMDFDRWFDVLRQVQSGEIEVVGRDTREPSPFSYQILNANPYAFLDDAPLEERRARAVATRRTLTTAEMSDLASLDPAAIEQVRREAWPQVRDAEELHDVLVVMTALPEADGAEWQRVFQELVSAGRATRAVRAARPALWVAAECWPAVAALFPDAVPQPPLDLPEALKTDVEASTAAVAIVRGWMEVVGPVTAQRLSDDLGLRLSAVEAALEALEGEGSVLRGRFTPRTAHDVNGADVQATKPPTEWCDRRLLARIHRLTLDAARRQVQPVEPAVYWRFLVDFQHTGPAARMEGAPALRAVVGQLQGLEVPGGAWETDVLAARIRDYDPAWLDEQTLSGEVAWGRLLPPKRREDAPASGSGVTRVVPLALVRRSDLPWLLPADRPDAAPLARADAGMVYDSLRELGALFYDDLLAHTGLLPAQLEDALSELAALGLVTADGFATIRQLVTPDLRRKLMQGSRHAGSRHGGRRHGTNRRARTRSYARGGRWSRFPNLPARMQNVARQQRAELWAMQLLKRYGVVFRDALWRESAAPPWRDLVMALRRLEAQGQVRGGRFIAGIWGEQYALPEAVDLLRRTRDAAPSDKWTIVSAADPLNLTGLFETRSTSAAPTTPTNGAPTLQQAGHSPEQSIARVAASSGNRLAIRDGRVLAALKSGEIEFYEQLPPEEQVALRRALPMSAAARNRSSVPMPRPALEKRSRETA